MRMKELKKHVKLATEKKMSTKLSLARSRKRWSNIESLTMIFINSLVYC